jgi:hypothetical protein
VPPSLFDKLDDATLIDWRRKGWLKALAYHMASMGQWQRLMAMASTRSEQAAAPAASPAKDEKLRKRRSEKAKPPAADGPAANSPAANSPAE